MKHLVNILHSTLYLKGGICVNKLVCGTDLIQWSTVVDDYSFAGEGTQLMLSNSLCCFMGDQLNISKIKI